MCPLFGGFTVTVQRHTVAMKCGRGYAAAWCSKLPLTTANSKGTANEWKL